MDRTRQPVIVGVHQITDTKSDPEVARGPKSLMLDAVRGAARDCTAANLPREADVITVVRSFADTLPRFSSPFGRMTNPPWSIAQAIGAQPKELLYTTGGGQTPQVVISQFCEEIAAGRAACAIMVGAEALRTQKNAQNRGIVLDWAEDAPAEPDICGIDRASFSALEDKYGLNAAILGYPVIEQAIRTELGHTPQTHQEHMGRLMTRLARVAQENPLATRRWGPTAEEIATPSDKNPYIGYPYTKLMNANVFVDQSAAIIVCSAALADAHGVPEAKRIYLNGCAQGNDHWHVSEREQMYRSPAIRTVSARALGSAGIRLDDVNFFDLYSCFPSAIEIACREIGLPQDDPRGISVTGGLPFFGGPGNNYVTHAIAEMVQRLRSAPGSYGLVTANGSYLAKHAAGVYSTRSPPDSSAINGSAGLQAELDKIPKAPLIDIAEGAAIVESYTVAYGRQGPERTIIVGRLVDSGQRFLANTDPEPTEFRKLIEYDAVGVKGSVRHADGKNRFTLSPAR